MKRGFFSIWGKGKAYLNILYLVLLFPMGIISFMIIGTLLSISLIMALSVFLAPFYGAYDFGFFSVNSIPLKILIGLAFTAIGILLGTGTLYLSNTLAKGINFILRKIYDF